MGSMYTISDAEEFISWLKGYLRPGFTDGLSESQVDYIRERMSEVGPGQEEGHVLTPHKPIYGSGYFIMPPITFSGDPYISNSSRLKIT